MTMQIGYLLAVLGVYLISKAECGEHPDGISQISREQDALGNYQFSYSIANSEGDQFRKEGTDSLGRVIGSYGLTNTDGTQRVVDYIADKNGFRAEVRSNEPGVISSEAADAPILKSDYSAPLSVAASSDSRATFGKRLREASSVDYMPTSDEVKAADRVDEIAKESRQRNFNDYRPLNPVAYYPADSQSSPDSQTRRGVEISSSPRFQSQPQLESRTLRVLPQTSDVDSKLLDVYFPPIDPHTAVRRPGYYFPPDRRTNKNYYPPPTSSGRPFIPPYGGFDDDPLPEQRNPGISLTTIHGGLGHGRGFPTLSPTQLFIKHPPPSDPEVRRDIPGPHFHPHPHFPGNVPHRPASGGLPSFPEEPLPLSAPYHPPSYDHGSSRTPQFVLRAVPIPNGIQAVKVDPVTGHVYERLIYPLFLRHDGQPAYDRNILLYNDDVSDEVHDVRNGDHGYFDSEFSGRPYRGIRNPSFSEEESHQNQSRNRNNTYDVESSLSSPTARDMNWIYRQLALVEGFERDFENRVLPNDVSSRDYNLQSEYDSDHPQYGEPNSRTRSHSNPAEFEYPRRENFFSRSPRYDDRLRTENSNGHSTKIETIPADSDKSKSQ